MQTLEDIPRYVNYPFFYDNQFHYLIWDYLQLGNPRRYTNHKNDIAYVFDELDRIDDHSNQLLKSIRERAKEIKREYYNTGRYEVAASRLADLIGFLMYYDIDIRKQGKRVEILPILYKKRGGTRRKRKRQSTVVTKK